MKKSVALAVLLGLGFASPAAAQRLLRPDQLPGVAAWYAAETLDGRLGNGDPVDVWEDQSGKGRHLSNDKAGLPAVYLEAQLNGRPAVQVGKANTYSVAEPFDLSAHTVALVYRSSNNSRALFRGSPMHGLLLLADGNHHLYQNGGTRPQLTPRFSEPAELPRDWSVTVLGRDDSSKLHAWVNGEDLSSGVMFPGPVQVARFFNLKHTQYASSDGAGLFIAELVIFDRFLTDEERDGLTAHLAGKYRIERGPRGVVARRGPDDEDRAAPVPAPRAGPPAGGPPEPRIAGSVQAPTDAASENLIAVQGAGSVAQLRSTDQDDLNDGEGQKIRWNIQDVADPPFRHDPKTDNTRLYCTRDDTRVRLSVAIPLRTAAPGPAIQLVFLKNGSEYLPVQAWSEYFVPAASVTEPDKVEFRSTVRAELITVLNAGDSIEVVTWKVGAAGPVTLEPRKAVLIAEVK